MVCYFPISRFLTLFELLRGIELIGVKFLLSYYTTTKTHTNANSEFNKKFWIGEKGKIGDIVYTYQGSTYVRSLDISDLVPIGNVPHGIKIVFNSENIYHLTVIKTGSVESIACETWGELLSEVEQLR